MRSALYTLLPSSVVALIRRRILVPIRTARQRRVPIAMITGTTGKTTTTRMLAHILTAAGHRVGFTSTNGVVIDERYRNHKDSAGYRGAGMVLRDPSITAAVLETARGDLLRVGLYINHCSVAALLNVDREQIEMDGIETVEEMANLKRKVLDVAANAVVLNADDAQCTRLLPEYPPERVTVFSINDDNPVLKSVVARGGIAYALCAIDEQGRIERTDHRSRETLITVDELPSSVGGLFTPNVQNAMAAAALAEQMQVPFGTIRQALSTFRPSVAQSPGRFNFVEGYRVRILVDHAVTVPACEALMKCLDGLPGHDRKICMVATIGNRPDWHFASLTALLAGYFDEFVCFETKQYLRNRQAGEINRILEDGLLKSGISPAHIRLAPSMDEGVGLLAELVRDGDFLVILNVSSDPEELLALLKHHFASFRSDLPDRH